MNGEALRNWGYRILFVTGGPALVATPGLFDRVNGLANMEDPENVALIKAMGILFLILVAGGLSWAGSLEKRT